MVSVLGAGLDTEFMMAFAQGDGIVDDANAAMYNHWIGTIPWLWVLAGLAGLALHSAARQGVVPRWIGRVGLVLGGLTVLLGISPLEYMSGVTGVLWLLVTALGFTLGDRRVPHRDPLTGYAQRQPIGMVHTTRATPAGPAPRGRAGRTMFR